MVDHRQVRIEDRRGTRLRFSRGVLSASLMATGMDPDEAYQLAEEVEEELLTLDEGVVPVERLTSIVEAAVGRRLGPAHARRWATWVRARRASLTTIVFLGGGTGVGKSTVATQLASRLGITRVVATDAIREVMRGMWPEIVAPTLHVSSFEAHRELRAPVPSDHDPLIEGFRQQAELVAVGVRLLVDRAITEQTPLIVEGAHLIPGLFSGEWQRWSRGAGLCQVVLHVEDPEAHRANFEFRVTMAGTRRPTRYLEQFDAIRRTQRYIRQQASAHGVAEVEMSDIDEAIHSILETVVDSVIEGEFPTGDVPGTDEA